MNCPDCGGELVPCSQKFVAKHGQAWKCLSGNHKLSWNGLPYKGIRLVWPDELQGREQTP